MIWTRESEKSKPKMAKNEEFDKIFWLNFLVQDLKLSGYQETEESKSGMTEG